MSIVTGAIGPAGVVIDVQVSVSDPRRAMLQKHGLPEPQPVFVRAVIDTGSSVTGFAPRVFDALCIGAIDRIKILTPSTRPGQPHESDVYAVNVALISGDSFQRLRNLRVIAADCWNLNEGVEALIGRDVLRRCVFEYFGPDELFRLSF